MPSLRLMARGMAEEGKWYQNREIIRRSHRKTFCLQSDYRAKGKFWGQLSRLPASSTHTHPGAVVSPLCITHLNGNDI